MKYVKAFDIWNPSILSLIKQGKFQVQSGQIVYRGNPRDVSIIDEIKENGHVRAFHGNTLKEARAYYSAYKARERIAARRRELIAARKEIDRQISLLKEQ